MLRKPWRIALSSHVLLLIFSYPEPSIGDSNLYAPEPNGLIEPCNHAI